LDTLESELGLRVLGILGFDFAHGFIMGGSCSSDLGFRSSDFLCRRKFDRLHLSEAGIADLRVVFHFIFLCFYLCLQNSFGIFGEGFDHHNDVTLLDLRTFPQVIPITVFPKRVDDSLGGTLDWLKSILREPCNDLPLTSRCLLPW
jgi:hypothetical protein